MDEILNLIDSVSEGFLSYFSSSNKVLTFATGSSMADKLIHINSLCRCQRYIPTQILKVNCWKTEVVPLVIRPSNKLSIVNIDITI